MEKNSSANNRDGIPSSGIYKNYLKKKYSSKKGKVICCWLVENKHNDNNANRHRKDLLNRPICLCVDRTKPFINGGTIFPDKKKDCIICFWKDRQMNQYAADNMGKVRRSK